MEVLGHEFNPDQWRLFIDSSKVCLREDLLHNGNTGRFIMFSVITNICNKKTKGPALMELFTATKTENVSFDNQRYSMCSPRVTRHSSIRYSSPCHTRVNMDASIFFTAAMIRIFRSARSRGLVCRQVLCVLCTKCTLRSNHRLTRVIFQHTKLLPRSGHFLTICARFAWRLKCELR